jgi:signal transduction histidine kinase
MLLKLISQLCDRDNRSKAAELLAEWFDCSSLIIFLIDPEIGILLPAPGFHQVLPDGVTWQQFTTDVAHKGYHAGTLPFPHKDSQVSAVGISGPESSVAILIGGRPSAEAVEPLQAILPLLTSLFKQEQFVLTAKARVLLADESTMRAEKLAATIDQMRTHLKDALLKQAQDKKDIQELMQKKDEFMNVASHELKTPVTTMKAYLQILNKKINLGETASAREFIHKAASQIEKLTALINDLLDVTKIHAGQMVYHFSELDLSEVIDEVVSHVQVTTSTHRIVLENDAAVLVYGEKHRLEQVISNFLSNAIKYSPKADQVIVSLVVNGKKAKVSIRDFGIGIPKDKQELVFDRFFRVQESSKQFAGLGLGLYISAEIIKRHDGVIGVESNGEGSNFYFILPVVTAEPGSEVFDSGK